jgi:hypothetical protein
MIFFKPDQGLAAIITYTYPRLLAAFFVALRNDGSLLNSERKLHEVAT